MDQSPIAVAAYEAAVPEDPRVARKQMFGQPAAFVNRQMFFGTFGDAVIARVGPERAAAVIAEGTGAAFTPREGATWADYVLLAPSADPAVLRALAADALSWTSRLPLKAPNPAGKKKKAKKD